MRRFHAVPLILAMGLFWLPGRSALSAAAPPGTAGESSNLEGIDELIRSVMKEWMVPGLALAVVKEDKVILSRGYGYRNVEKKLPVTPRTLFAIGSNTKSVTVTLLSMLAEDGKLDWDEPVRTYLPDFRLSDPVAMEHMTARDLVTHRSGLPRHDGLWYGSDLSRQDLYRRLRHLKPSKDFRSTYQYNNLMFMTAGYLAGKVEGTSWEQLVKRRILEPLGMNRSNLSVTESRKSDDFSLPYMKINNKAQLVPFRNIDAIGPAGSINSCVDEMIRYVQLHINRGKHGERRLISEQSARAMQSPQMVIPGSGGFEEFGHSCYGLGFVITTYRGRKLVQHGGGIDGFISLLSFLPRERIGLIVLTNLSGENPTTAMVTNSVLDRLLGADRADWAGRFRTGARKARENREKSRQKEVSNRKRGTLPSHALAEYAGTYEHPAYGAIQVEEEGGGLRVRARGMVLPLEHYHYDVFEVGREERTPLAGAKVLFYYNKSGDMDRLAAPLEPAVDDIIFQRVADDSMRKRKFLEQFVGEYLAPPGPITVALKGEDTLTLAVPGQPTYTLVPRRETTFEIKGLNGFSIEFKKDASGSITELVSHQPNGSFAARRKAKREARAY